MSQNILNRNAVALTEFMLRLVMRKPEAPPAFEKLFGRLSQLERLFEILQVVGGPAADGVGLAVRRLDGKRTQTAPL